MKGLYANIHAKRKRIEAGSGEKMRKPGTKGAPTAKAFKQAKKTVRKKYDMKETPMEVKVMKLEAKPEEEEEYKMESEDGEAIDMTPIKELRKRLRGK